MADGPVLDSDILIDYLRGAGPGCDLLRDLSRGGGYRVTAVSAFELALARSYRKNPKPVHAVLGAPVLTLTRKAGLRGGELLAELRRRGKPIDLRDALQAGICLETGSTLVSRNVSHFKRISGLRLLHPDDVMEGRGWAGDLDEIRARRDIPEL